MLRVTVNTRVLHNQISGVQRYTKDMLAALRAADPEQSSIELREVPSNLHGVVGHSWEQFLLPFRVGNGVLWSPSNTGPLAIRNQVVTIHDTTSIDHPEWFNPRFAAWYRWLTPRLVRRVRKVVADSKHTKERVVAITGVDPGKVSVVYIGANPQFYPRGRDETARVLESLNLHVARYVLSLGSLEPRKNLPRLVEAWGKAQRDLPPDMALLITGGKGVSRVFQNVSFGSLPPKVHFTGFVKDEQLPALYSGATAFAYVSEYEGFGLPPLEAMSVGVPPLTGDRTSIPEIVGDAGLMVNPFDVDEIAAGLVKLITDGGLRRTLSEKGIERARLFSWSAAAREMIRIFKEAASDAT